MTLTSEKNPRFSGSYAQIPAPVLNSNILNDQDKILYARIANLTNQFGFCWASNSYLAEISNKSVPSIKRMLKKLVDNEFISIVHCENKDADQRKIFLSDAFAKTRKEHGGGWIKNEPGGGSKMSHIINKQEITKKTTTSKKAPATAVAVVVFSEKIEQQLREVDGLSNSAIKKLKSKYSEEQVATALEVLGESPRDNPAGFFLKSLEEGYKPSKTKKVRKHTDKVKEVVLGLSKRGIMVSEHPGHIEFPLGEVILTLHRSFHEIMLDVKDVVEKNYKNNQDDYTKKQWTFDESTKTKHRIGNALASKDADKHKRSK